MLPKEFQTVREGEVDPALFNAPKVIEARLREEFELDEDREDATDALFHQELIDPMLFNSLNNKDMTIQEHATRLIFSIYDFPKPVHPVAIRVELLWHRIGVPMIETEIGVR